jgi:hypothetical protein
MKKATASPWLFYALCLYFPDKHWGTAKNLAPLVFRVPNFIFWLKEGVLSMSRYFLQPLTS